MSRGTDQRTEIVFHEALKLRREERPAYLEVACGADAALRAEVESLLAAHDRDSSFMAQPAGGSLADKLETVPLPDEAQNALRADDTLPSRPSKGGPSRNGDAGSIRGLVIDP